MSKAHLLLVDDNTALLNALARLLRHPSFVIHRATSASQAWEILANREQEINLVISDNQMPGERGVDFLRSVKNFYPDTVRIMLTGNSSVRDVQTCVNECEVFRFFTKPWEPEALRRAVHEGLRLQSLLKRETANAASQITLPENTDPVENLEKDHPGITRVDRDSQGYVVLHSRFPTRIPFD